jgi:hypothetical protein
MKHAKRLRRCRAVTLIEAVLYIAIALALIIGGLLFFQQADLSQRSTSQMRSLGSIIAETKTIFAEKPELIDIASDGDPLVQAAVIDNVLIINGSVPVNAVFADAPPNRLGWPSPIRHGWGGALNVLLANRDGRVPHFLIYLENIPSEVCLRLSSLTSSGKSGFVERVTEIVFQTPNGGGGFSSQSLPSAEFPLPIRPNDLGVPGNCGSFGGRLNVIYWIPAD